LRGDLRALYLAWLASAARQSGAGLARDDEEAWDDEEERDEVDSDDLNDLIEPPVPPGLGSSLRRYGPSWNSS